MAGNKRNSPASLFELLNKSDLKASQPASKSSKPAGVGPAATPPDGTKVSSAAPSVTGTERVQTSARPDAEKTAAVHVDVAASTPAMNTDRSVFSMRSSIGPSGAAQRREAWQRPTAGPATIGGIPRHLIIIGACVLVALVILIMLILPHRSTVNAPQTSVLPITGPTGIDNPKLVSVPNGSETPISAPRVAQPTGGRVVPAAQVRRNPNNWYLVIITTLPAYAHRVAQFIARRGISVTVEPAQKGWDAVISVRGFRDRANPAAIVFRRRVVAMGLAWPSVRRTHHSPWNDAYFAKVQRYP